MDTVDNTDLVVSFGTIADLQYCDADPGIGRYYRNAPVKLSRAFDSLNKYALDFVINLGDTIDRDWKSFDGIISNFEESNNRVYHVLGNHDYEVEDHFKSQVHERIGTSKYYDFSIRNWRFIVLDGNEISTYANVKGTEKYKQAENYLAEGKVNSNFWNGAVGSGQLAWLEGKLKEAAKNNEQVIIFCHFPIYPSHKHNLLNDTEVVQLIKKYNSVKAWICGHNHEGNYGMYNNTHFVNLKGMVDTEHQLAFGIFKLYQDRIELQGFGSEVSAKLIV